MTTNPSLEMLTRDPLIWNQWREDNPSVSVNWNGMTIANANLKAANLSDAYLIDSSFRNSDLRKVDFQGAYLKNADFCGANLSRADFSGAYLYKANFKNACLRGAKLKNAYLEGVQFDGADLRDASSLDTRRIPQAELEKMQPPLPSISVKFHADDWTPGDVGIAMMGLQWSFNRLQYLCSTDETDVEMIQNMLVGSCATSLDESIRIVNLETGSLISDLAFLPNIFSKKTTQILVIAGLLMTSVATCSQVNRDSAEVRKLEAEKRLIELRIEKEKREDNKHEIRLPVLPNPSEQHVDDLIFPEIPSFLMPDNEIVAGNFYEYAAKAIDPFWTVVSKEINRGSFVTVNMSNCNWFCEPKKG